MKSIWPDGSEMARKIIAHDWSCTPVGPVDNWPQDLRNQVRTILATLFPTALLWGGDLTVCAYNDAYRPLLGQKPEALGRPFLEVWQEAEEIIKPQLIQALQGEACYFEDAPFTLLRFDQPDLAYFDYCFSPVRDENGFVVGIINTAVETTRRKKADEALVTSRERMRAVLDTLSEGVI